MLLILVGWASLWCVFLLCYHFSAFKVQDAMSFAFGLLASSLTPSRSASTRLAARVIFLKMQIKSITLLLKVLQWLPIAEVQIP